MDDLPAFFVYGFYFSVFDEKSFQLLHQHVISCQRHEVCSRRFRSAGFDRCPDAPAVDVNQQDDVFHPSALERPLPGKTQPGRNCNFSFNLFTFSNSRAYWPFEIQLATNGFQAFQIRDFNEIVLGITRHIVQIRHVATGFQ